MQPLRILRFLCCIHVHTVKPKVLTVSKWLHLDQQHVTALTCLSVSKLFSSLVLSLCCYGDVTPVTPECYLPLLLVVYRCSHLYTQPCHIYSCRPVLGQKTTFAVTIKNFTLMEFAFFLIYNCWGEKKDTGANQCKICTYIQLQISYVHEY